MILGSDSFIGGNLKKKLLQSGYNVLGTTKRRRLVNKTNYYLNLDDNNVYLNYDKSVKAAILCAGITNIDYCEKYSKETYYINVINTKKIIYELIKNNTFIVFLSTNLVFDGSIPFCKEDDKLSPVIQYGKQKAEVEKFLMENSNKTLILRLTKVIGSSFKLFEEWKLSLLRGEKIYPYYDMKMSPIPVSFVISVLKLLIDEQITGIFHLSGEKDITYKDAACMLIKSIGSDAHLIEPVKGKNKYKLPENTTLNIDKLISYLGVQAPYTEWTIMNYNGFI